MKATPMLPAATTRDRAAAEASSSAVSVHARAAGSRSRWCLGWIGWVGIVLAGWLAGASVKARIVGQWPDHLRGEAKAVVVGGSRAFVALGQAGIVILDLSDPGGIRRLGSLETVGQAEDLDWVNDLLFVAEDFGGLGVFEVGRPGQPRRVGGWQGEGQAKAVRVVGDLAYVAGWDAGLQVIDVSRPSRPVRVGGVETPGFAADVAVVDGRAYVACWQAGLQVYDLGSPRQPRRLGGVQTADLARRVDVAGTRAFVADGLAGLAVIDVSNPVQPVGLDHLETPGDVVSVRVEGTRAWVGDAGHGLLELDLTGPTGPAIVGFVPEARSVLDLELAGSRLLVADGPEGLRVLEIGRPGDPAEVGGYDTGSEARGLALSGDRVWLADGAGGLRVLDTRIPARTDAVGGVAIPAWVDDVKVVGSVAYLAGRESGLWTVDLSRPETPVALGNLDTPGLAGSLDVVGAVAYVADGAGGLRLIDVRDPASPKELGSYLGAGRVSGVRVVGTRAYVAARDSGLHLLDVGDPTAPVALGAAATVDALAVTVAGDRVAVADGLGGVSIFDGSDPAVPRRLAGWRTGGTALDVKWVGSRLYVADGSEGVKVLDVSDATRPRWVGTAAVRASARRIEVEVEGGLVFVADGPAGLTIVRPESVRGEPPRIQMEPVGREVRLGEATTLTVTASGDPTLVYQWRRNGNVLPGATGPTLTLPAIRLADLGLYTVVVANEWGSVESRPAAVQPEVTALSMADRFADRPLSEAASGLGLVENAGASIEPGEPRHAGKRGGRSVWTAWRAPAAGVVTLRTVGSDFDTLLSVYRGTAFASLELVASDEDGGGFLTSEVRFNAEAGVVYAIAVDGFNGLAGRIVLSWELDPAAPELPRILRQPASVLAPAGSPVTFDIEVAPAGSTVQWWFNGEPLPGQNQATLGFVAEPARAGSYWARVTAPNGQVLGSAEALLEITDGSAVGAALSADKLDDLFADDELAAGTVPALHGRRRMGPPPAVGLPGSQWTDNTGSGRGAEDSDVCEAVTTATRWFRLRFNVPPGIPTPVRLTTAGSQIATLMAVYTNRTALRMMACDVASPPERPSAEVIIEARREVDYLVLVDGVAGAQGAIQLNWEGEERFSTVRLERSRFSVELLVPPGAYDWQQGPGLGSWDQVLRTNVNSGIFRYEDAEPPVADAKFFRLVPAP